ncbi:hypothetical protein ACSSS7_002778 [Eimeria intestinalis]
MEYSATSEPIWPDLAPPVEAVHLRQTYNALKAVLLSPEAAGRLQSFHSSLSSPNNEGRQLVPLALSIPLRLQKASCTSPRGSKSKQCIFKSDAGLNLSKDLPGSLLQGGSVEAAAGLSSLAMRSSARASCFSRGTEQEARRFSREDVSNGMKCSNEGREDATPSNSKIHGVFNKRRARSRARSSDHGGIVSSGGSAGKEWISPDEDFLPVKIKSLVTRLQHCTYSGKAASLRWDRLKARSLASTAVVHSNSSEERASPECDVEVVLSPDHEVAEALRIEALERVRQRAREERVKQRQHEEELLLARQQQKQRSLVLSQQLRQRTLQRIREKCIREEEQRKEELQLQMQRIEQAEAQRQYCARHRKELHQRLLQRQREIKRKILIRAEESVRHSADAKARHLTWDAIILSEAKSSPTKALPRFPVSKPVSLASPFILLLQLASVFF